MSNITYLKQLINDNIHVRPDVFLRLYPSIVTDIINITNFLPLNSTLRQRFFHIINDSYYIPICIICNNEHAKWNSAKQHYIPYCGRKCMQLGVSEKRKQTNLARYGGVAPACSKLVQNKMKQTNIIKYGVENYNQSIQGKQQHISTIQEKYGVNNISQIESVKIKKQETSILNYGTIHPTQSTVIREKIKQTCINRYGVTNPKQSHILIDNIIKSYNVDWLINQHHTQKQTLTSIAQELQIDITSIIHRFELLNIEKRKYGGSNSEKEVANFLIQNTSLTIKQNDRSIIAPLELDIWIPELNIAIEYCGLYWHSLGNPNMTITYHLDKLNMCKDKGIRLITLYSDEWIYKQQLVKNKILHILGISTQQTIYARKCNIISVDIESRSKFLNMYHIQGNGNGSITWGLEYNNELVACITLIRKRNDIYELNRYATSANVVGGFSKLLSHIIKNYTITKIYTFADMRWSEGDLYEKTGFILDYITPPLYDYVRGDVRYHRSLYARKFLPTRLQTFDPNLTEKQNCINNRIYQIYNCGLKKYVYIPNKL